MGSVGQAEELVDGWQEDVEGLLGCQSPDKQCSDTKDQSKRTLDESEIGAIGDRSRDRDVGRVRGRGKVDAGGDQTHENSNKRHTVVKARAVVDWVGDDRDQKDSSSDHNGRDPPDRADHVVLDRVSECPLCCPDAESDQGASDAVGNRVHSAVETSINNRDCIDDQSKDGEFAGIWAPGGGVGGEEMAVEEEGDRDGIGRV